MIAQKCEECGAERLSWDGGKHVCTGLSPEKIWQNWSMAYSPRGYYEALPVVWP